MFQRPNRNTFNDNEIEEEDSDDNKNEMIEVHPYDNTDNLNENQIDKRKIKFLLDEAYKFNETAKYYGMKTAVEKAKEWIKNKYGSLDKEERQYFESNYMIDEGPMVIN